jgi:hypothetical protein
MGDGLIICIHERDSEVVQIEHYSCHMYKTKTLGRKQLESSLNVM